MALKKSLVLWLLAAVLLLAGCGQEVSQPTAPPPETEPPVEQLTLVVTADTIDQLEDYPALKRLDLTGSTCYAAIADYMQKHPFVDVTYTVELGTVTADNRETALVLDPGACDYDTLVANLPYLPKVETVSMPRTTYSPQEIVALEGLFPGIRWDYTVILLGQELTRETETVNLSVLEPQRVQEAAQTVGLFPNITRVELMDAYGQSGLSPADVKIFREEVPNAQLHYSFPLFGRTVSTTDEHIEFVQAEIGNQGEAELRAALDILPNCKYLLLDDCGFDNEVLAQVRRDYPETEIVWRVHIENRSWLTDTDTIRAVYHVNDRNVAPLQYCTKTKYLDLGPSDGLTDLSFLENMPDLEILILSGSPVSDLSPLEGKEKLIYLELAYCGTLEDISVLSTCPNLAYINLSYTKVVDISALYELPLLQLCAVKTKIDEKVWEEISQRHPNCVIRYDGTQPYGTGWRYKKNGAYTDIYARIREIFNLDEIERQLAGNN